MRIGIVGGGTAGLAAALLLHDAGHAIEVLERFEEPTPVGAGILLQPTGLKVLQALGLRHEIEARGSRVDRLFGETASGRTVLNLTYAGAAYGVGVHRHILFDALWRAVAARDITVTTGTTVTEPPAGYDLVLGCDGARSKLRFAVKRDRPYPWGAAWAIVDDPDERYAGVLHQTYRGTREMVGTLPSGRPDDGSPKVSLFISAQAKEDVDLDRVRRLAPRVGPILDQIDDLLWAGYMDVVLRQLHQDRLVLLGDAAHAMSPQLGQGANLALIDAWVLADCLAKAPVDAALAAYSRRRKPHLRFYSTVSRAMTPAFQSRLQVLGPPRDLLAAPLGRVPFVRDQMLGALAGARTSPWRELHPPDLP